MGAERAPRIDDQIDDGILDAETSAAILHWMQTALTPPGVKVDAWESWIDGGCQGRLDAGGRPVSAAMLGRWARSGILA